MSMVTQDKQERITFYRGGTFLCFGNGSFDLYTLSRYSDLYDLPEQLGLLGLLGQIGVKPF